MLQALNTLGKPLIGRVGGAAYGGGVGLMAVCDVVVAVETRALRADRDPARGDPGDDRRPTWWRGSARAGRGRCSSRRGCFDAAEAQALGLVSRVVAPEALDAAVEAEVAPYFATAPAAVAAAKRLARASGRGSTPR